MTNGFAARGLSAWIARATSSLPVPLSPCTSTVESNGATSRICATTARRGAEAPTSPWKTHRSLSVRFRRSASVTSRSVTATSPPPSGAASSRTETVVPSGRSRSTANSRCVPPSWFATRAAQSGSQTLQCSTSSQCLPTTVRRSAPVRRAASPFIRRMRMCSSSVKTPTGSTSRSASSRGMPAPGSASRRDGGVASGVVRDVAGMALLRVRTWEQRRAHHLYCSPAEHPRARTCSKLHRLPDVRRNVGPRPVAARTRRDLGPIRCGLPGWRSGSPRSSRRPATRSPRAGRSRCSPAPRRASSATRRRRRHGAPRRTGAPARPWRRRRAAPTARWAPCGCRRTTAGARGGSTRSCRSASTGARSSGAPCRRSWPRSRASSGPRGRRT